MSQFRMICYSIARLNQFFSKDLKMKNVFVILSLLGAQFVFASSVNDFVTLPIYIQTLSEIAKDGPRIEHFKFLENAQLTPISREGCELLYGENAFEITTREWLEIESMANSRRTKTKAFAEIRNESFQELKKLIGGGEYWYCTLSENRGMTMDYTFGFFSKTYSFGWVKGFED